MASLFEVSISSDSEGIPQNVKVRHVQTGKLIEDPKRLADLHLMFTVVASVSG